MFIILTFTISFLGFNKSDTPIKLYANVYAASKAIAKENAETPETNIRNKISKAAQNYGRGDFINSAYYYRWLFPNETRLKFIVDFMINNRGVPS